MPGLAVPRLRRQVRAALRDRRTVAEVSLMTDSESSSTSMASGDPGAVNKPAGGAGERAHASEGAACGAPGSRRPRAPRYTSAFVPQWVYVTGFFPGVELTHEMRRTGIDNLVWYAKRRIASLLEERCERGFHPRLAPWSRRFIGGHVCVRPFSDQEFDARNAHVLAAWKEGRDPTPTGPQKENLCGPVPAAYLSGGGEADAPQASGKQELFDDAIARLETLQQDPARPLPPSDRYAGWEPSQIVAWELNMTECRLNEYFREATGASARTVCDVMCARDAAYRIQRAADRDLAAILDDVLAEAKALSGVRDVDSYAMSKLVNASRRAWNAHRRSRGWSPMARALALGYRNHARLREGLLMANLPAPDAIELDSLRHALCQRLKLTGPAKLCLTLGGSSAPERPVSVTPAFASAATTALSGQTAASGWPDEPVASPSAELLAESAHAPRVVLGRSRARMAEAELAAASNKGEAPGHEDSRTACSNFSQMQVGEGI